MAKFSEIERAAIIAQARETVERLEEMAERVADDVIRFVPREDWVERWKREAAQSKQERRPMPRDRHLTDTEAARLENKLTGMVGEQRQFILQVITETLGEFRDDVTAEVDGAFARLRSEVAEIRAMRTGKRDDDKVGERVFDWPPLPRQMQ